MWYYSIFRNCNRFLDEIDWIVGKCCDHALSAIITFSKILKRLKNKIELCCDYFGEESSRHLLMMFRRLVRDFSFLWLKKFCWNFIQTGLVKYSSLQYCWSNCGELRWLIYFFYGFNKFLPVFKNYKWWSQPKKFV